VQAAIRLVFCDMVTVKSVMKGSIAYRAGFVPGDIILSINGNNINDVLDYRFYLSECEVEVKVHRGPDILTLHIEKDEYDDIGLDFETFLMDEKRSCRNKCIFCFIDQLPSGMRDTLYFKDDDSRLSFLQGNYITLTNLSDEDVERICKMKMSPMNVSVHTTSPELRCTMMKNRFAGNVMETLKRFAEAGIKIHAQIVLCKGVNDKDELTRSMRDLSSLYPALESCSIVPAGLTKHREGLYPLEPFNGEECAEVIAQVEAFADKCLKSHGSRIFFCGDEMYLKAGLPLHDEEYYEGYPQIENGVGLIRSMQTEFDLEYEYIDEYDTAKARKCAIATGKAAYPFICSLVEKLKEVCYNLECDVHMIENDFFGENITVAGLITGSDLIAQLKGKDLGDTLYIPRVMLRSGENVFLDDVTTEDVERELGVKVCATDCDGAEFISSILN